MMTRFIASYTDECEKCKAPIAEDSLIGSVDEEIWCEQCCDNHEAGEE